MMLRVSVPGRLELIDIGHGNGRSAKSAIGGGTIVRPGPSHDIARMKRQEYRKLNHDREIAQQRARRAAGKR